jgi:tetratricopeptide (TPR) repeat protein
MTENPFPGLRPFKTEEAHLFFGREGQSEEILSRLRKRRFVAVVGASGSGKSSLINAGLLPYLHGGFMPQAGSHWRVATFRPGDDPIGNLARALNHPEVLGSADPEDNSRNAVLLEVTLRRSGLGLIEAVRLARLALPENVLIVVDQFEELFRFADAMLGMRKENDAAAFTRLLLEASGQKDIPIYTVLTMRSDFIGDCARIQDLPEAVTSGLYLIPRMTREQQRAAIEEPAHVGGAEISPRLVNRLLNDIGDDPDRLPILQHALMRTWDYWQKNHSDLQPIDLEHYIAIGTVTEALSRHADDAYAHLEERQREIAKRLFQCLTEKGSDNRELRRPTAVQAIAEVSAATVPAVIEVIECFRQGDRSFLMPPSGVPLTADSVIDISHESLIRGWKMLRDWVDEEFESAKAYKRLADTAVLFAAANAGLLRDADLSYVEACWKPEDRNAAWAKRYHPGFEQAMEFLERSRSDRDAGALALEHARRQELRRWRQRALAVGVALALAVLGLGLAWWYGHQLHLMAANSQKVEDLTLTLAGPSVESYSKIIDTLEAESPNDPKSFNRLFIAYTERGDLHRDKQEYRSAESDYQAADRWAGRLDASNPTRKYDRFVTLERMGTLERSKAIDNTNPQEKERLLQAAIRDHSQSRDQGLQLEKAEQQYSIAIEESNIGKDYFELKDFNAAKAHFLERIAHYQKAAESNPGEEAARSLASAYDDLSEVEFRLQNYDKARSAADLRITQLKPFGSAPDATSDQKNRLARAYGSRSWFDLFVADYNAAIADSDQGLALNPDAIWILTNKAHAYLFLGQIPLARKMYLDNATKPQSLGSKDTFGEGVLDDFEEFKKHPAMNRPVLDEIGKRVEKLTPRSPKAAR